METDFHYIVFAPIWRLPCTPFVRLCGHGPGQAPGEGGNHNFTFNFNLSTLLNFENGPTEMVTFNKMYQLKLLPCVIFSNLSFKSISSEVFDVVASCSWVRSFLLSCLRFSTSAMAALFALLRVRYLLSSLCFSSVTRLWVSCSSPSSPSSRRVSCLQSSWARNYQQRDHLWCAWDRDEWG